MSTTTHAEGALGARSGARSNWGLGGACRPRHTLCRGLVCALEGLGNDSALLSDDDLVQDEVWLLAQSLTSWTRTNRSRNLSPRMRWGGLLTAVKADLLETGNLHSCWFSPGLAGVIPRSRPEPRMRNSSLAAGWRRGCERTSLKKYTRDLSQKWPSDYGH